VGPPELARCASLLPVVCGVHQISTLVSCEFPRVKQVLARDVESRQDLNKSGLAHALSLVRIDVNCECSSLVSGVFLIFLFFGFSFLVQRPFSCSPTAARHLASLEQQGAARRGKFLCA